MLPDLLIPAAFAVVLVIGATVMVRSPAVRRGRLGRALQGLIHSRGRRGLERQLAASEARFRELTLLSSDWVWETDADHRVSYLSDSIDTAIGPWCRSFLGVRPWETSGFGFVANPWGDYRALAEAHLPVDNFEYSLRDPDGRVFFLAVNARPVFDRSGAFTGYRGTGRNITRERQQRILLEVEGEIAAALHGFDRPDCMVRAVIGIVCKRLGWMGGVRLVREPAGFVAREHQGSPEFLDMVSRLQEPLTLEADAPEAACLEPGMPCWLESLAPASPFAARYDVNALGARAALIVPLGSGDGGASSLLLLFSPVGFRGEGLVEPIGQSVSRTLALYLERAEAEARLRRASLHDALTGLPNRAHLRSALEQRLAAGEPLALLYIDLDRYKLINDSLGHAAGDRALVEISRRLSGAVGPDDLVARMGGDEFVLLLAGRLPRERIESLAQNVLARIEQPLILSERAWFVSASIGVAVAPDDGNELEWLLRAADSAMYTIKATGRNAVGFFSGELSSERAEQLELAAELPAAIERGEVELHYQPIMAIGERRVVCVEALLRWRHPSRGMLLPERFLPAAEQSRLIRELGLWALRRALEDRALMGLEGYPEISVSLNVSAHQLVEDDFVVELARLLPEHRIPPQLLRLELTESAFVEHPERTAQLIARLRGLGVRVIIDSFGTGYASFAYLKDLPVDGLKIDRKFVRGLPGDRGNAAIVQAITTMARSLGMQAMAEGVETAAELRGLRMLECDQVQGALIAEPMPVDQLVGFLETLPLLRGMHRAALPQLLDG